MAKDLFKTSHARVKVYRKCRRAHWYKYFLRLARKRVSRPLAFGRLVHEMVEAYSNDLDPFKHLKAIAKRDDKMFRSQAEEYGNLVDDVRVIMMEYFDYWKDHRDVNKRLTYLQFNGKKSEHTFELEIAPGLVTVGKIDNFAKTPNKLRWLTEHKSGKAIPNEDHRWRNLQSAIYIRIADMLDITHVDGTVWDYIRSKPPAAPKILKSGDLSARGLDTLPLKVIEVFKEEGIKPTGKYKGLIKQAEDNRDNYFQRIFTPVKKRVVDTLFKQFVETSKEMADNQDAQDMNIDRHCEWCEYEPLCRAMLQDLDVDFIMKKEYEERAKAPEEEADFEG